MRAAILPKMRATRRMRMKTEKRREKLDEGEDEGEQDDLQSSRKKTKIRSNTVHL